VRRRKAPRATVQSTGSGHEPAEDVLKPKPRTPLGRRLHPCRDAGRDGVHISYVVDIFSRAAVDWAAARHKRARLVLDALDMALWHRDHGGHPVSAGVIHHSDAGSPSTPASRLPRT
jgi:transposase InsO family protein